MFQPRRRLSVTWDKQPFYETTSEKGTDFKLCLKVVNRLKDAFYAERRRQRYTFMHSCGRVYFVGTFRIPGRGKLDGQTTIQTIPIKPRMRGKSYFGSNYARKIEIQLSDDIRSILQEGEEGGEEEQYFATKKSRSILKKILDDEEIEEIVLITLIKLQATATFGHLKGTKHEKPKRRKKAKGGKKNKNRKKKR